MISLQEFLDVNPTSFHVVKTASLELEQAGFASQPYLDADSAHFAQDKGVVHRGGALIAWNWPVNNPASDGVLIYGAHTDSPGLHLKPNCSSTTLGWAQLNVEIYGGVLLNSWLDRDLGVAGRVHFADGTNRLISINEPIARIAQLAIHLDREISEKGLQLHRQHHMKPIWGANTVLSFMQWLCEKVEVSAQNLTGFDLQLFDTQKSALLGSSGEFLVSGRLDNQVSCWAAVRSLIENTKTTRPTLVALFDHEEVGSESINGAAGPLLEHVLEELLMVRQRSETFASIAKKSFFVSADNAHAIHPNYVDKHDAHHAPMINMGPVVKRNANQRYATNGELASRVVGAASRARIPIQDFVANNAMPCGSTIGPISATRLGIDTIDLGVPQLSMHSAREMCGSKDPDYLVDLFTLLGSTDF
jgi:aspartyl aminopeptidase